VGSYFREAVAQRGVGSTWEPIIQGAAATYGVPAALIKGIISAESAWDPAAVSPTRSSYGLMQLNVVAQAITQAQAFDAAFAIPFGARILAGQIARRSSTGLALAGYNAGTSRTDADLANRVAGDVNGVGTYVQTVLDYATWFSRFDPGIVGAPGIAPDGGLVAPPEGGGGGGGPAPAASSGVAPDGGLVAPPADTWPFPAPEPAPAPDYTPASLPSLAAVEDSGAWILLGLGILVAGWWVLSPARR
jgi:hypothetical protein